MTWKKLNYRLLSKSSLGRLLSRLLLSKSLLGRLLLYSSFQGTLLLNRNPCCLHNFQLLLPVGRTSNMADHVTTGLYQVVRICVSVLGRVQCHVLRHVRDAQPRCEQFVGVAVESLSRHWALKSVQETLGPTRDPVLTQRDSCAVTAQALSCWQRHGSHQYRVVWCQGIDSCSDGSCQSFPSV